MVALDEAVGRFSSTAIVGAGGKTSTLFRLARTWRRSVFLANSAHLGLDQMRLADHLYEIQRMEDIPDFDGGVPEGISLFCGPELAGRGRVSGLGVDVLDALRQRAERFSTPLIIEADGARGLALKAPAEHEPPVPAFVDGVIVVAGLTGLGKNLDERSVFRPEIFSRLSGLVLGGRIDETALARVLCHPQGGLKNIPAGAKRIVLLNQADEERMVEPAARLAQNLLAAYNGVVVAALQGTGPEPPGQVHRVYRPNAGIVLAAGGSRRMGMPKQLLEWEGEVMVRRAAKAALEGGLEPVVVVSGARAEEVERALSGLRVAIEHCPDWETGQSVSIKAGLKRALDLRHDLDGACFLLCDQPYVGAAVVRGVADLRAKTLAPVCAPFVNGRRCNPVLFSKELFSALFSLNGDAGGRAVLEGIDVARLEWTDPHLGEEFDTPEEYTRMRGGGPS